MITVNTRSDTKFVIRYTIETTLPTFEEVTSHRSFASADDALEYAQDSYMGVKYISNVRVVCIQVTTTETETQVQA